MPTDSAAIDAALTRLRSLGEQLPYPGSWLPAARAEAAVVVLAEDDGLSRLAVDGIEAVGERLADRFREIAPVAVADENAFWSVAAEELGYGMICRVPVTPRARRPSTRTGRPRR
ncbi:SUKH-4 family immunity protein [Micromonospora sp. NBC_01655]|uniref:hypothetical protein n=1 Tax=Micromonospora sp. NBC_01655 TaxID=2975983 RepID=UPI002253634C|nr:hypothetical protein [Micromonospora sp. NBC_01655]MCX4472820.1 SUKH-4 family immunity protein [Micromonospora sp. NBC_01655]